MAKAVAEGQQALSKALIPALKKFINGIEIAAGFFSTIEHELMSFENKASNADDDPKKCHYMVMKTEAKDMKATCQTFYAVLPTEGTDQNYVDEWLKKQKKIIRVKCSVPGLAGKIVKAISVQSFRV
ncbi:hypothetical protein P5673_008623 [Acropora cervicornis]|uniref:Uncharacterized protein n=1 Tax=Acropora cervicornis TaxID=6130 RepID=A0AAD9VA26_ACRCE|nr:hypothetical protein P5673_008623 [Acropora cervicornis]